MWRSASINQCALSFSTCMMPLPNWKLGDDKCQNSFSLYTDIIDWTLPKNEIQFWQAWKCVCYHHVSIDFCHFHTRMHLIKKSKKETLYIHIWANLIPDSVFKHMSKNQNDDNDYLRLFSIVFFCCRIWFWCQKVPKIGPGAKKEDLEA